MITRHTEYYESDNCVLAIAPTCWTWHNIQDGTLAFYPLGRRVLHWHSQSFSALDDGMCQGRNYRVLHWLSNCVCPLYDTMGQYVRCRLRVEFGASGLGCTADAHTAWRGRRDRSAGLHPKVCLDLYRAGAGCHIKNVSRRRSWLFQCFPKPPALSSHHRRAASVFTENF